MNQLTSELLNEAAQRYGTPLYVYFPDEIANRVARLKQCFGDHFEISFAVKCNPNVALLRDLAALVDRFDISAIAEADRVLEAGVGSDLLSFSGPAKRLFELRRAVDLEIGEMVCESLREAQILDQLAAASGTRVKVLIRINPSQVPRHFGVNMAGKPSQFGVDEEDLEPVLAEIARLEHISLIGFHIYSGTNSLNETAIAENFAIFIGIFQRATAIAGIRPQRLIFGSGFGVPYLPEDEELDIAAMAQAINPMIDTLKQQQEFADSECALEMGRWIVGPAGYLLTRVITEKTSRGSSIKMCDAGFNNHLAACGMMGTLIRRNWNISKVTPETATGGTSQKFTLVGPLCTTIDTIATNIEFPSLEIDDVLAIHSSGAYGLSASPTRFISHPCPGEVAYSEATGFVDISETD